MMRATMANFAYINGFVDVNIGLKGCRLTRGVLKNFDRIYLARSPCTMIPLSSTW